MKKLFLIVIIGALSLSSAAQFTKATLQATGLTCAMCSNAINRALQKISFIESVKPDIKNSSFGILFKANSDIDIDVIKRAVEDAGFSVGGFKITGNFRELSIGPDKHVKIGSETFHFINTGNQTLNGEQTLVVIDKGFVSAKDFKKYSSTSKMACLQSGKAEACCIKDGVSANTRIYHVTI